MNILHLAGHYGGGVGSVLRGWVENDPCNNHTLLALDKMQETKVTARDDMLLHENILYQNIEESDIIITHLWDNALLYIFLSKPLPECRLAFWAHKNYPVPEKYLKLPDVFMDTSPIQGHGDFIWSTGGVDRFLKIQPKPHEGFNIGYIGTVDYKKMHHSFFVMGDVLLERIPNSHMLVVGDVGIDPEALPDGRWTFTGKVDDVAPYLAEMDVFGYPLRLDHYGTCEQVLGEAMASGVVPVVMDNACEKLATQSKGAESEEQYVDLICSLYDNPKERRILSDSYRIWASRRYAITPMVLEWQKVFNKMMENPKRSHP